MMCDNTIPVEKAARVMQVNPQFLRVGLQNNRFPFGTAVLVNKRWSYYINAKRFWKYMEAEDMIVDFRKSS